MTNPIDRVGASGNFFRLLVQNPKSRYLALEGLITGGLSWRIRAWLAERHLARTTEGVFEASGDEYETTYRAWQDSKFQARFGRLLSKKGKKRIQHLLDKDIPEPIIRTWIVNGHIDEDGTLNPRRRTVADPIVRLLGWIWHGLVVVSAFIFIVYVWALPGAVWRKILATAGLLIFFSFMSILMNSTSLSSLPPRRKASSSRSVETP